MLSRSASTYQLAGAPVHVLSEAELLHLVDSRLQRSDEPPLFLGSANLDHIRHFGRASGRAHVFRDTRAEWILTLDGMPLVWRLSLEPGVRPTLITGSDLLPGLIGVAARRAARVGILGGSGEMHRRFRARFEADAPTAELVYASSPARADLAVPRSSRALARDISDAGVELLLIALGKPRQEDFLLEHDGELAVRVAACFGAAADFYAGTQQRAPRYMRGNGLEWAYRLMREPRRMSRRYLVQGPVDLVRLRTAGPYDADSAER